MSLAVGMSLHQRKMFFHGSCFPCLEIVVGNEQQLVHSVIIFEVPTPCQALFLALGMCRRENSRARRVSRGETGVYVAQTR